MRRPELAKAGLGQWQWRGTEQTGTSVLGGLSTGPAGSSWIAEKGKKLELDMMPACRPGA